VARATFLSPLIALPLPPLCVAASRAQNRGREPFFGRLRWPRRRAPLVGHRGHPIGDQWSWFNQGITPSVGPPWTHGRHVPPISGRAPLGAARGPPWPSDQGSMVLIQSGSYPFGRSTVDPWTRSTAGPRPRQPSIVKPTVQIRPAPESKDSLPFNNDHFVKEPLFFSGIPSRSFHLLESL
jgi:hypothetical protein